MSPDEQTECRGMAWEEFQQIMDAGQDELRQEIFKASFGIFDLL